MICTSLDMKLNLQLNDIVADIQIIDFEILGGVSRNATKEIAIIA